MVLLSTQQMADALGVDRRTIWLRVKSGDLIPTRTNPVTGRHSFSIDLLNDIMANGLPWRRKPEQSTLEG
jgi:hypothetical protein